MPEIIPEITNEELKNLLEQNLEYNQAIYGLCRKTKRYLLIVQIMSWLRVLLILVPLILAIIFLPPLIKSYLAPYQELLGGGGSSILNQLKGLQGSGDLQNLLK